MLLPVVVPHPHGSTVVAHTRSFASSDVPAFRQHPPYGGGENHLPRSSRGHCAVLQQPWVSLSGQDTWCAVCGSSRRVDACDFHPLSLSHSCPARMTRAGQSTDHAHDVRRKTSYTSVRARVSRQSFPHFCLGALFSAILAAANIPVYSLTTSMS